MGYVHPLSMHYASFFLVSLGGVRLSPLGTSATVGLLYQPRMIDDDDYGAVGGMRIGRGNRNTRREPAPVPLCPPQIPHDLTWECIMLSNNMQDIRRLSVNNRLFFLIRHGPP
jgi:hypothetical protein